MSRQVTVGSGATHPPATKCAHDFATGAGFVAIEATYLECGGPSSPVSRECRSCVEPSWCLGRVSGSDLVFMKGESENRWFSSRSLRKEEK